MQALAYRARNQSEGNYGCVGVSLSRGSSKCACFPSVYHRIPLRSKNRTDHLHLDRCWLNHFNRDSLSYHTETHRKQRLGKQVTARLVLSRPDQLVIYGGARKVCVLRASPNGAGQGQIFGFYFSASISRKLLSVGRVVFHTPKPKTITYSTNPFSRRYPLAASFGR